MCNNIPFQLWIALTIFLMHILADDIQFTHGGGALKSVFHIQPHVIVSGVISKGNKGKSLTIKPNNAQYFYLSLVFVICHFSFRKTKVWSRSVGNFAIKRPILKCSTCSQDSNTYKTKFIWVGRDSGIQK